MTGYFRRREEEVSRKTRELEEKEEQQRQIEARMEEQKVEMDRVQRNNMEAEGQLVHYSVLGEGEGSHEWHCCQLN